MKMAVTDSKAATAFIFGGDKDYSCSHVGCLAVLGT